MKTLRAPLLAAIFAATVTAQPLSSPTAVGGGATGNLLVQPIGPNDLVSVSVYDAPELTRPVRVNADGLIHLPMLAPVKAAGLFPSELEVSIAKALRTQNVMVNPLVTVTIAEFQSRPIRVAGAVKTPLTFQAQGRITLLDALARAGGVSDAAGTEVLITRADLKTGGQDSGQRVPLKELLNGNVRDNILLTGGEEILVSEAEQIYVVGSVRKPGVFIVHDRSTPSVLKMLALTEGLAPFHQKMAYIYRDDAARKIKQEVPVELNKILQRKAPDVPLMPNDVLYIPENGVRRSWTTAMERVVTLGGSGIGAALLYK